MKSPASADVVVIGAGPAGALAALHAGDLGARTLLLTRGKFGGMAAHDGPVPVRTLAHAARLIRDARQLDFYGIAGIQPVLNYTRLLARVREVVEEVASHAALREQVDAAGVTVYEETGVARFLDSHTVLTESGLSVRAERIILCTGGASRRLAVPGFELTATHSDAWSLTAIPEAMLVIGGGAAGVQVASIFNAFGTRVELFEAGPRILRTEDHDVAAAVGASFRRAGIDVHEDFGSIEAFEEIPRGVRMVFSKNGAKNSAEAPLVVVAAGWTGNAGGLDLAKAGVEVDARGFVRVDDHLCTSAPHIFAAGDVTGRLMLVPQAMQDGSVAGTNAVRGPIMTTEGPAPVVGSFTDPEYAHVGATEAEARKSGDPLVAAVGFESTTRMIIDGRTTGFCKLIVDRATHTILGCHVVGDHAVDIVQTAAIGIAGGLRVDDLVRGPLSFPTYTGILSRAAAVAARQLSPEVGLSRIAQLL